MRYIISFSWPIKIVIWSCRPVLNAPFFNTSSSKATNDTIYWLFQHIIQHTIQTFFTFVPQIHYYLLNCFIEILFFQVVINSALIATTRVNRALTVPFCYLFIFVFLTVASNSALNGTLTHLFLCKIHQNPPLTPHLHNHSLFATFFCRALVFEPPRICMRK